MFVATAMDRWRPTPILIAAMAAICLWAITCAGTLAALHGPRLLGYRIVLVEQHHLWRVTWVWPGSYAWDAALRPGTLLSDVVAPATRGSATLHLLHSGIPHTVTIPPPGEPAMTLIWLELALAGAVLALGTSTLLYARERKPAVLFLLFCLAMACGLSGVAASAQGAIWGGIIFESCWFVLIPPLTVLLALSLPRGGRRTAPLWPAIVLLAVAALLLEIAGYRDPARYLPSRAAMGILFLLGQAAAAALWAWRGMPARGGPDWSAYRLVLVGMSGAFGGFALCALLPALLSWHLPWPAEAGGLVLLLFPITLSLALLRHRLLDLRRHLQRAAVSVVLLCGAMATGFVMAGAGSVMLGLGLAVGLAGIGMPLAQRAVDRRLPDGQTPYAALLQRSGARLAFAVTRADLVTALEDLRQGLGLAGMRLCLGQEGGIVAEAGTTAGGIVCTLPVAHDGTVLATLEVAEKLRQEALLSADQQALGLICQQLGTALARQRLTLQLYGTVQRLEQAQQRLLGARRVERQRLGQLLHRGPLQGVMLLCQSLAPDSAEGTIAAQVGAALRAILTETTSATLRERGLSAALHTLGDYLRPHAGERGCSLLVESDPVIDALSQDASFAIYALAHEALVNAVRHSGGQRIGVRVALSAGRVEIEARDDGCGLPNGWDEVRADHRGLRDALDLVRTLPGAKAKVETATGVGTVIRASIPIEHYFQRAVEGTMAGHEGATRLLIAEDHAVVREGLRRVLAEDPSLIVVAEARTGLEILSLTLRHRPDILLLDIDLPGQDGLEALAEVQAHLPEPPRAIVLSAFCSEEQVRRAHDLGVRGFLSKGGDGEGIRRAVECVVNGESAYDQPIADTLGHQLYSGTGRLRRYADGSLALSEAERQVLRFLPGELTYEQIAAELGRATGTVRNQAASVLDKLSASSRQQAVLKALHLGILQLEDL